jgi:hypothetical protein
MVAGPAAGETDLPRTSATVRKGPTPDEALVELAADDTFAGKSGAEESSGVHQILYAVQRPNESPDFART